MLMLVKMRVGGVRRGLTVVCFEGVSELLRKGGHYGGG